MPAPPVVVLYVPTGHGEHVRACLLLQYPAAHGLHASPAPPPYVPAGQGVQRVAASVASNTEPSPVAGARNVLVVAA
jgi:hypothetical protein